MAMAHKSDQMGMHTEQLAGRTQQRFFSPEEDENFVYPGSFDVDFTLAVQRHKMIDAIERSSATGRSVRIGQG